MRRGLGRLALVALLVGGTTAHVGSPNAILDGRAGPYPVRVIVRPPEVIPGMAEVTVRVLDGGGGVQRVSVRPVFWRTGRQGSPAGDEAARVAGVDDLFAGKLWLMSAGSYSIEVEVSGSRGTGMLGVPVVGMPTAELSLGTRLKVTLGALGLVLVAGLLSIVHAGAGEALLAPGAAVTPPARRRARIAAVVALPVVLALTAGGWNWWQSEAEAYRRTLSRPLDVQARVVDSATTGARLELRVTDSTWTPERMTPLIPDHGKIMHMFVIEAGGGLVFAHLHPERTDDRTFTTPLPPLPPGRYDVFGDVVHESGFTRTLVGHMSIDERPARGAALSPDDAWVSLRATDDSSMGVAGGHLVWLRGDTAAITAGRETMLRFELRDEAGSPLTLEPYMGMLGHAVVVRSDASVFIHLHPMGTGAMAAQEAFMRRERGDTTPAGRLRESGPAADSHPAPHRAHAGHRTSGPTVVSFPYEFPRPGHYVIWVQVKHGGEIRTGRYEVHVD